MGLELCYFFKKNFLFCIGSYIYSWKPKGLISLTHCSLTCAWPRLGSATGDFSSVSSPVSAKSCFPPCEMDHHPLPYGNKNKSLMVVKREYFTWVKGGYLLLVHFNRRQKPRFNTSLIFILQNTVSKRNWTTVWEEKGLILPCPLIHSQKGLPSQSYAFGEYVTWCGPGEGIMTPDWGTVTKVV